MFSLEHAAIRKSPLRVFLLVECINDMTFGFFICGIIVSLRREDVVAKSLIFSAGISQCSISYSHSEGPGIDPRSLGFFSGASDSSMCPGVDSASKNEYQDIPGGKDGRCVRVTTLPPSCSECLEILEP